MKPIFFIIAVIIVVLFSCRNSNNRVAKFQGHWEGAYTGLGDHGTFNINIDYNGLASGTLSSVVTSRLLQLDGKVDSNSMVYLTYRDSLTHGTFTGSVKGSAASGKWASAVRQGNGGTWECKKRSIK